MPGVTPRTPIAALSYLELRILLLFELFILYKIIINCGAARELGYLYKIIMNYGATRAWGGNESLAIH
jgi:hypothetical protein